MILFSPFRHRCQRIARQCVLTMQALARRIAVWVWPDDFTGVHDQSGDRFGSQHSHPVPSCRPALASFSAHTFSGPVDLRTMVFLSATRIALESAWPGEAHVEPAPWRIHR
jgi:hypothetical protein